MKVAEVVEANLQNISGVVIAERLYRKYVRCAARKP
jgi:hypothetical protein